MSTTSAKAADLDVSRDDGATDAAPSDQPDLPSVPRDPDLPQPVKYTKSASDSTPLSMKMLHRPSRAAAELSRSSDPTRRNSLQNARLDSEPRSPLSPNSDAERLSQPGRLVRKKSGEVVKSSLKEHHKHSRSKSLPSTPSAKQVHFGSGNDIRYFSRRDTPTSISAHNSPSSEPDEDDLWDNSPKFAYLDEELNSHADHESPAITKYPFPKQNRNTDWHLSVLNGCPMPSDYRISIGSSPVFLDQVFISIDKKYLLGHIAVKNIAFEKAVTVRYTVDNWCTIVEVPTIYVPDTPLLWRQNNYDRFVFKLPLASMFNPLHIPESNRPGSQERLYELCIRYNLPNQEHWDNNSGENYRIKLVKTVAEPKPKEKDPPKQALKAPLHVPPSAHSKPQEHNQKPKYSSHYLKRIFSDPTLSASKEQPQPKEQKYHNEFAKENFNVSPPLLSSLETKSPDSGTVTAEEPPEDEESPLSPTSVPPSKNFGEFKSYKELLDSYCFFNGSPNSGDSSATLASEEPAPLKTKKAPEDLERNQFFDNAFTVSTFLRH